MGTRVDGSGAVQQQGKAQEASTPREVPENVTAYLSGLTDTKAFNGRGTEINKLMKSLPRDVEGFFAPNDAFQSINEDRLFYNVDSGNKYILYPHSTNVWEKNDKLYGMAITPEGDKVMISGTLPKWGHTKLSIAPTGVVIGKEASAVELYNALRQVRADANTKK